MVSPGTVLSSRYRIDGVLGRGGMGAVYLARQEALGDRAVAVKEMELSGLEPDERAQAIRQFHKEASFLAHLRHPNLVRVTDFFTEGERHYLVMEHVEGRSLHEMLCERQEPFSWEEVKPWARALTEVLHYLHSQNPPILFRDLKPSNVMLANNGKLHLIDFGIARRARQGSITSTFLRGAGSSGFAPIEQYGNTETTDQRSDIYALGATLYTLLTGVVTPDAVARVSDDELLVPPSQLNSTLPPGIDRLLDKALALRQRDRYQTITEFATDIDRVDQALAPNHQATTLDLKERPASWWPSLLTAGALFTLGLAILMLRPELEQPLEPTAPAVKRSISMALPPRPEPAPEPRPESPPRRKKESSVKTTSKLPTESPKPESKPGAVLPSPTAIEEASYPKASPLPPRPQPRTTPKVPLLTRMPAIPAPSKANVPTPQATPTATPNPPLSPIYVTTTLPPSTTTTPTTAVATTSGSTTQVTVTTAVTPPGQTSPAQPAPTGVQTNPAPTAATGGGQHAQTSPAGAPPPPPPNGTQAAPPPPAGPPGGGRGGGGRGRR